LLAISTARGGNMESAAEKLQESTGASLEGLEEVFGRTSEGSEATTVISSERFGSNSVVENIEEKKILLQEETSTPSSEASEVVAISNMEKSGSNSIVEGLDTNTGALEEIDTQTSEGLEAVSTISSEEFGSAPIEVITTEEAAKRLGISARAVLNRIKAGTLAGKKIKGRFKEEWRVLWSLSEHGSEGSEVYSEVSSEPVTESSEDDGTEDDGDSPAAGVQNIAIIGDQLKTLTEQSQALSYRNGYLEAQLEFSRTQLKLLPDYQARASETEILKARVKELEEKLAEKNRTWWQRFFQKP